MYTMFSTTWCIGYRQPAPDPHGSRTGSRYDWLACGTSLACRRRGFALVVYRPSSSKWRRRL